ncbi:CdaR family protein [Arthrospiribacter ruber]|uniref:YbbR-like domain-containing protein n=1 Tax=Arthrospiribacter ruber TaxID=2487934 RepID=A0A951IVD9_9BACT|nr:YbbR-like domain-containing protein [Arthrospiribacter ruber]MBW3467850.1 YbbR-like domain-containing protein [Arthrospiribacter ruber]
MAKIKKRFTNLSPQKIANLKVAALCFFAAATFWVLNALNKDNYTTVVDYPIEIVFDPEEFMPVEKLPNRIKVEVNGNGWDLLRKYFKVNESPFTIEINNPSTKNYILTSEIRRGLAESISPTNLVSMVSDTITFNIDKVVTRKIRIQLDTATNTLARNYRFAGDIEMDPNMVNIKGPTSILQKLDGAILVKLGDDRINKNFNKILPLQLPDDTKDFLTLDEESVHVKFDVYQMLEGNKRLKIKKLNFPNSVSLEEEPTVIMRYMIDERRVQELNNFDFEAVVNYYNRNRDDSTVTVQANPRPPFLENIQLEPSILKLRYE